MQGGAHWLDVRLPSEFENHHLDGAVNIPLYFIRLKIKHAEREYQVRGLLRHGPAQLSRCLHPQ